METRGLQKAYKSGACLDYFETFGHQKDVRAFRRTSMSLKDMMALNRIRTADRQAALRAARAEAKAVTAKKLDAAPAKLGIIRRAIDRVRSLLRKGDK